MKKKKKSLARYSLPEVTTQSIAAKGSASQSPMKSDEPSIAPPGLEGFLSALKSFSNTDTFSDAIIVCEGQEFKVHRIVLSAHSKYFAKQLGGNWKESADKKIEIKDFDTSVVEAMLHFMYSFQYSNTYSTSSMVYDAQVYQIADKYDIPGLKEHSSDRFSDAIAAGWRMDDFPLAITVVYESTPSEDRGLRDLVVKTCCQNIDTLLAHSFFCETLRKVPDFAADLVPAIRKVTSDDKTPFRFN